MISKELELKNFRNYDNLKLSFSPNINVFMEIMLKEKQIYLKVSMF